MNINEIKAGMFLKSDFAEIAQLIKDSSDSIWYIGELKKFILHLQDYISAKHLESEGLILEKFIQEENDAK